MPSQSANEHEVERVIRNNWKTLAFLAYQNWLERGRGCFVFINGIKDLDVFGHVTADYAITDDFTQFFSREGLLTDEVVQTAQMYDPETSLVAYVFQPGETMFVYLGIETGLPAPKAIWSALKDDPAFTH